MPPSRSAWPFLLAVLAAGCSPYLRRAQPVEQSLQTNVRCTQGPLTIEASAHGARWGEYLELRARSPRAFRGRYRLLVDGRLEQHGEFASATVIREPDGTSRHIPDRAPQNELCIQRPPPAPLVTAFPPASPSLYPEPPASTLQQPLQPAPPASPPPTVPEAPPRGAAPGAYLELHLHAPGGGALVVAAPLPGPSVQRVAVEPQLPPAQPAPQAVVVTPAPAPAPSPPVEPAPPEPVIVPPLLVQTTARPPGLTHHDLIVSWYRENRSLETKWNLPAGAPIVLELWSEEPNDFEGAVFELKQGVYEPNVTEPEYLAWLEQKKAERERKEAERQAERRREWEKERLERAARREYCLAHRENDGCWAPGGSENPRPPAPRRARPAPKLATTPPAEPVPQPHPPTEPPPPAVEQVPRRPTAHAEWIAGYWHWTGFDWAWLEGWWKVPEPDLKVAIAAAATPAPAPRVETRAAEPFPGAVWRAGTWIWGARGWMWLPGGWWHSGRGAPPPHAHSIRPVPPRAPRPPHEASPAGDSHGALPATGR